MSVLQSALFYHGDFILSKTVLDFNSMTLVTFGFLMYLPAVLLLSQ